MTVLSSDLKEPLDAPEARVRSLSQVNPPPGPISMRLRTLLAVPLAAVLSLIVHVVIAKRQLTTEVHLYSQFLIFILALAVVVALAQRFWPRPRRWLAHMCPIIAAAMLFLCLWELITAGFRWLPLPYFPSPA